jgi:hypothetical protein
MLMNLRPTKLEYIDILSLKALEGSAQPLNATARLVFNGIIVDDPLQLHIYKPRYATAGIVPLKVAVLVAVGTVVVEVLLPIVGIEGENVGFITGPGN